MKPTVLLCIDTATKRVKRYEPMGQRKVRCTAELEIMSQPDDFDLVKQLNDFRTNPGSFLIYEVDAPTEAA